MKKQILSIRVRKRTLCLVIADFHTREVYALYFHICPNTSRILGHQMSLYGAGFVSAWGALPKDIC